MPIIAYPVSATEALHRATYLSSGFALVRLPSSLQDCYRVLRAQTSLSEPARSAHMFVGRPGRRGRAGEGRIEAADALGRVGYPLSDPVDGRRDAGELDRAQARHRHRGQVEQFG